MCTNTGRWGAALTCGRRPIALTGVLVLLNQKSAILLEALLKMILLLYGYKEVLYYIQPNYIL